MREPTRGERRAGGWPAVHPRRARRGHSTPPGRDADPGTGSSPWETSAPVHAEVRNLSVSYSTRAGELLAVDGVSFELAAGQWMGVVGESGCGKTSLITAMLRLLPDGARAEGQVLLDGQDVLTMSKRELRAIRWRTVGLVTQGAMNSLDPVYRIGEQIVEGIRIHTDVSRAAAWARTQELCALVGLPADRIRSYPHQLSGGMRQRAVIAMALSLNPGLLVADEPTTALDVIMQDQILGRLHNLRESGQSTVVLVTHDVAIVAEHCEKTAVMYAGRIVEAGPTADVLQGACHPYTMGLRGAVPDIRGAQISPISIPGSPDSPSESSGRCAFAPRCPFSRRLCWTSEPELRMVAPGHLSACHYAEDAERMRRVARDKLAWRRAGEDAAPSGVGG